MQVLLGYEMYKFGNSDEDDDDADVEEEQAPPPVEVPAPDAPAAEQTQVTNLIPLPVN